MASVIPLVREPVTCVIAGSPGDPWVEAVRSIVEAHMTCEAVGRDPKSFADACGNGGDVLAVLGPCAVGPEVPGGLRAHLAPDVGTVSALPAGASEASGAREDGGGEIALVLEQAIGPVVLLSRAAMDLIGGPRPQAADPGAGVAEFSDRCAQRGLANILAGGISVGADADGPAVPAVDRARARLRRRSSGLSVTIDARALNGPPAGTQVHILELIGALAGRCSLRVVLPPDPSRWASEALARVDGLELRSYDEVNEDPQPTDVVHRPHQVYDFHDIALLRRIGHRLVVTHQDQLLFRNPTYMRTHDEWLAYRRLSRLVHAWADRVTFFTVAARAQALRDGIVEETQAAVVPIGAQRRLTAPTGEPSRPEADWDALGERPALLMLGSDLVHKNRPFALRLLQELRALGWDGGLVLAGPELEHGSTRAEEQAVAGVRELPVVRLGSVGEAERAWLLRECAAVAFPSLDEGFGLVPFEAGAAGRPCLFAPIGPLHELLPGIASLVPWDPRLSAAATLPLLSPGPEREAHIKELRAAAQPLTWGATADWLLKVYEEAADAAERPIKTLTADAVEREERMAAEHAAHVDLWDEVGEIGLALIGRTGTIPPGLRRPLLTLTGRRLTRAPLFALLRLIAKIKGQAA